MLAVAAASFLVQALAWAVIGAGLRRVRDAAPTPDAPPADLPPFSVVVAARDEEERLPTLLRALEDQRYAGADGRPAFEVVVVDDRSGDATAAVVEEWARRWAEWDGPALRLARVAPGEPEAAGLPPKKHALERGAAAARHARLAFTDADGRPPPTWLATLARWAAPDAAPPDLAPLADADRQPDGGHGTDSLIDDGAVLIGYGPYEERPGPLNRFVRYETVQTATLAAAAAGWGRPWHAVGRNLSYPRALLERLGGFAHSAASLSGDDDLLVQEVARRRAAPVRYVWDGAGAVPSPAPPDARAFWRQKRRHASAGAHYPVGVLVALGLFHTSNLVLWAAAPALHLVADVPYGWGLVAAKLLLQRTALTDAFDALGAESDLRLWQPVLDLLSAGYHAVLAVLGALPTPTRW